MAGGTNRRRAVMVALGAVAAVGIAVPSSALAVGSITGTVTESAGGTPLSNYEVEVWQGGTPVSEVCTGLGGVWTAPGIPDGTYQVYFSGDGSFCAAASSFAPEWYGNPSNFYRRSLADPVVVNGAPISNINASLEDGASVGGTVTDAFGGPVLGVTVDLIDADNFTVATECTVAGGNYTMDPVAPGGIFSVRFDPSGSCGNAGAYAVQWYDQAPTQSAADPVTIFGAGQDVLNINGTMLAPVNLSVTTAGAGSGTVTGNRGGISCPGVCSAALAPGTVVDLTAQPAAGSVFTGWSGGGCTGTQTCQVTMNAAQAVTATFQPAGSQPTDPTDPTDPTNPVTPPTAGAAPNTTIDQAKVKAKRGKATFAFSGSGGTGPLSFECSLTKARADAKFEACTSAASFKRLKRGKYRFEVRARGADGRVDGSPATQSFKSKPPKRK